MIKCNIKLKIKKSNFFKFKKKKIKKTFKIYSYSGRNKSLIICLEFNSTHSIDNLFIKRYFPQIFNKEKIFIITSGKSKCHSNKKILDLKKLDAISIFLDNFNYNFKCKKNTQLFIVSSQNFRIRKCRSIYFNFEKDLKAIDIWGGQCISRSYVGVDLNLVLFNLKSEFKFSDKGHMNEQITWLISGSMNFYCNNFKSRLTKKKGVYIGAFHEHGGISNGAQGFDAFFPKRKEKRYNYKNKFLRF